MSAPASLLLAARTLVQFPRNPLLLGFSLAPVLMMFLVFGALFEGVTRLPGFPTDNYFEYLAPTAILLTTVPGIGNAAVALAADFQSRYVYKLLHARQRIVSLSLCHGAASTSFPGSGMRTARWWVRRQVRSP